MEDIRLKTAKYAIAGREYTLICHMTTLADIQAGNNGDFRGAIENPCYFKTALKAGAIMCNDWAEQNEWEERFTDRTLGRVIPASEAYSFANIVLGLVKDAIEDVAKGTQGEEQKN